MTLPVSIIIVNYNGRKWLPRCLESIEQMEPAPLEIIVVDNHSTDESVAYLRSWRPKVQCIEHHSNSGFAGGNDVALPYARGEYILLLNTDTEVTPTLLHDLIQGFAKNPRLGCVQPKMLFLHDTRRLDSCGSWMTPTGFLHHVGNQQSATESRFQESFPVFSVKGACMLTRRDVIERAGGLFDPGYWCYFEETDFCQRVWMAGYECWYDPSAVILHAMGGTTGHHIPLSFAQYHSFKNRLQTYLVNFSIPVLIVVLPLHSLVSGVVIVSSLLTRQWDHARAVIRGHWYIVVHARSIWKKRTFVQNSVRRVSDWSFLKRVGVRPNFTLMIRQLYYFLTYEKHKHKIPE